MKYGNRIEKCELNIEANKANAEKKYDNQRSFVEKMQEMLLARIDQITQFENNIENCNNDIAKLKAIMHDQNEKMGNQLSDIKQLNIDYAGDFRAHVQEFQSR
jgi:peptidoglycan hydrolase CwlO-like protein